MGQSGSCTFVVEVAGGKLWKRHVTQLRERVIDVSDEDDESFVDVTVSPSAPSDSECSLDDNAPSPLLFTGWRSGRTTNSIPPNRFF